MRIRVSGLIVIFFVVFSLIRLTSAVAAPVSIMPLGDSITSGNDSGAKQGEEVSYRKALRDKLVTAGYEIVFVGSQESESPINADLNHEGHSGWCASGCYQNRSDILREIDSFLASNPPDVVLLHIGTNDIRNKQRPEQIVSAVSGILDKIYRYGREQKRPIWVILALIMNGQNSPCVYCQQTTAYNQALGQMAQKRIKKGDKLILVDMENGAGIDYRLYPVGDMWDALHPDEKGYQKMANVWFEALEKILIPSGNILYQALRANRTGGMRYFDEEKKDPSPIPTAQTSVPPVSPVPTPPALPPAISVKEPEPVLASKPAPAEGPKAASKKEPPSDSQVSQPAEIKGYAIQVNAFRDLNLAEEFVEAQKKGGHQVYVDKIQIKDQGGWYKVYIGRFADRVEAARYMKEMKIKEFFPECFIQKLP